MNTYICTGHAFDFNYDEPEQSVAHLIELYLASGRLLPADLSPSYLAIELASHDEVGFTVWQNAVARALRLLSDRGIIVDSGMKAESDLTSDVEVVWKMGISHAKIEFVD